MPQATYTKETKKVPLKALRFAAASVDFGDAGAGGTNVPVTIVARSPQPVDHWYFGRIVHDFAGMKSAAKISLDYCHNDNEILGFADKFSIDPERGLIVGGALTPFKDGDRANEVLHKSKMGVPYEASIFFDPAELVLEFVPEGFSTPVNGYQFEGPGVVAREWLLRNLAICPNGQDRNTAAEFSAHNQGEFDVKKTIGKGTKLSKKAAPKKAAAKPATKLSKGKGATKFAEDPEKKEDEVAELEEGDEVTTTEEGGEAEVATPVVATCPNCEHEFEVPAEEPEGEAEAVEMAEEGDEEEEEEPETKLSNTGKRTGKDFLTAFGTDGAIWFAEGKTFAQAQTLFNKKVLAERDELKNKNKELSTKLSKSRGERKPVTFSNAEDGGSEGTQKNTAGLSPGLAKFAAGITLPTRGKKK